MLRKQIVLFAFQAVLVSATESAIGNFHAPGRADRMHYKRAPRDLGTFEVDCKNSESACNNACFYINCANPKDPDANKITYIGPNGGLSGKEDDKNRKESGCEWKADGTSGSVCSNFPFSQAWSDKQATDYQCDEWPPAMSQQQPFNPDPKIRPPNSLRCMPGTDNVSLGGKLGAFVTSKNAARDDYFRVDFTKKIGSVQDKTKVRFCLGQCWQDGFQFAMTKKPTVNGKISAHYNAGGNDNQYSLLNTPYKELFQCGVEFVRSGDKNFQQVKLSTWDNKDKSVASFSLRNDGDTFDMTGLPRDLQIKRTGVFGSKMEFVYAPGQKGKNINYFEWDSEMSGNGRGPWTDPVTDPDRKPLRFCKVVDAHSTVSQKFECWFPCYQNADGR